MLSLSTKRSHKVSSSTLREKVFLPACVAFCLHLTFHLNIPVINFSMCSSTLTNLSKFCRQEELTFNLRIWCKFEHFITNRSLQSKLEN